MQIPFSSPYLRGNYLVRRTHGNLKFLDVVMSSVYSLERLSKDILTSHIFKAALVFEVLFENYRHSFEHRNNYVNRLFYRSIYHFTIVY